MGGKTRNIRYSIRFGAMVQDKSHVFLLPVFPPNDGNSDDDDENKVGYFHHGIISLQPPGFISCLL